MPNGDERDRETKPKKRRVSPVRSSCQPGKREFETPTGFPDDLTPDELAEAVVQPVEIDRKDRPD